ncbi:MAG: hypothetical protein PHT03_08670, partial [Bacilli bacterium]|nr:hypothetical protein [Bacilli bacterium]
VNTSFVVAISEKQLQDSSFRIGDVIKGTAWTKMYPEREYADYYRTGALTRIIAAAGNTPVNINLPPWRITPPDLKTYEWRGARMLSLKSWKNECFQCVWANMANVTIEYNWGKTQKHRFESFCYGPKSCKLYKMGRPRAVPYKGRDTCYDDGELDKLCTENRDDDE